jgi:hypothetical protein
MNTVFMEPLYIRHTGEGRCPACSNYWVPAYAGMTKSEFLEFTSSKNYAVGAHA